MGLNNTPSFRFFNLDFFFQADLSWRALRIRLGKHGQALQGLGKMIRENSTFPQNDFPFSKINIQESFTELGMTMMTGPVAAFPSLA